MSFSDRIIMTLFKGATIPMDLLKRDNPYQQIEEECLPLISNGSISLKDGILFMSNRQMNNARLLFDCI